MDPLILYSQSIGPLQEKELQNPFPIIYQQHLELFCHHIQRTNTNQRGFVLTTYQLKAY